MTVLAQKELPKRAYKISELKSIGGPGHDKAYREIKAGRLRAVKMGRHTLVPADDFELWLKALPAVQTDPQSSEHGQGNGRPGRGAKKTKQNSA